MRPARHWGSSKGPVPPLGPPPLPDPPPSRWLPSPFPGKLLQAKEKAAQALQVSWAEGRPQSSLPNGPIDVPPPNPVDAPTVAGSALGREAAPPDWPAMGGGGQGSVSDRQHPTSGGAQVVRSPGQRSPCSSLLCPGKTPPTWRSAGQAGRSAALHTLPGVSGGRMWTRLQRKPAPATGSQMVREARDGGLGSW